MILIGASGHAKVIIDILEKSKEEIGFLIDSNPTITELMGYQVLNDFPKDSTLQEEFIIAIGSNAIRKRISEEQMLKYGWAIHPSAILGDDVSVGVGTVIMASATINSSVKLGNHCIINTSASVDHDCKIGDFTHISPGVTLCGGISIGEGSHIGAGATIIPNIKVGQWVTIGAGAVIIRDVPDYALVVGNPGRIIRINDGEE